MRVPNDRRLVLVILQTFEHATNITSSSCESHRRMVACPARVRASCRRGAREYERNWVAGFDAYIFLTRRRKGVGASVQRHHEPICAHIVYWLTFACAAVGTTLGDMVLREGAMNRQESGLSVPVDTIAVKGVSGNRCLRVYAEPDGVADYNVAAIDEVMVAESISV